MKKVVKQEFTESTIKGLFGAIPFAGTFINEVIFEARSRIKQDRVNSFVNDFASSMDKLTEKDIDLDNIDQLALSDVIEEVLISVSKTSARHKHKSFKNILRKQFKLNSNSDEVLRFISITNSITAIQFKIMYCFSTMSDKVLKYSIQILELQEKRISDDINLKLEKSRYKKGLSNNFETKQKEVNRNIKAIKSKTKAINENIKANDHQQYGINQEEYLVEVQDLIGRGLLFDQAITTNLIQPFTYFGLTRLGRKYIGYVKQQDDDL